MPKAVRPRPAGRYRQRWRRLRAAARALVLENAALCDEVARLEEKWLRARGQRRFLLGRLLGHSARAAGEGARRVKRSRPAPAGRGRGGKGGVKDDRPEHVRTLGQSPQQPLGRRPRPLGQGQR
uniref:Transforming growth factor beta regulator 1 n=1 Tax=Cyanoderma ruficeps TaxID=181631 RepID=A0A8C3QQR8_9PASS